MSAPSCDKIKKAVRLDSHLAAQCSDNDPRRRSFTESELDTVDEIDAGMNLTSSMSLVEEKLARLSVDREKKGRKGYR